MVIFVGMLQNSKIGNAACKINVIEPAVLQSATISRLLLLSLFLQLLLLCRNFTSVEPTKPFSILPFSIMSQISFDAMKCWFLNPGFLRPALIFII